MNATCSLVTDRMELLRQLFSSATHDASVAMCRWTDGLINLTLDEVCEIPLEEVTESLGFNDRPLIMVVLTLEGDLGGVMLLTFDQANGRQLASALLGQPPREATDWTELEQSALTETGNILGCAYMNALTRLISHRLVPSPPYFIEDYAASVLQQALMAQAAVSDQVLICRTGFHRQGTQLNWHVIFVPTDSMREAMHQAMHARS